VLALEPSGADTELDCPPLMASTWATWMASGPASRNVTRLSKVCVCLRPRFADGDVNRHVIEALAYYAAEVLPSGCRHNLAQAVVR
jgi:hypothetical protein